MSRHNPLNLNSLIRQVTEALAWEASQEGRAFRHIQHVIAEKEKARLAAIAKDESAYFTSEEFREEVINELIANGATRLQATNRTRDQVRLFAEADALGLR